LKWYDGGGENGIISKGTLRAFLFLPLFSFSFFLFFYALSPDDSGVLMIFEEKITSSKNFFSIDLT
jgi:hypothetical protein